MRGRPDSHGGFVGGLNTRDAIAEIDLSQARDLSNVVGYINGAISKRNGCPQFNLVALGGTPNTLKAIEGTVIKFLLVGTTANVLTSLDAAGAATAITPAAAPTSGLPWAVVEAPASGGQGPVYLMNGSDTPLMTTNAGVQLNSWTAATGVLPNGKYALYAGNRVIVAGTAANPSRVQASALQDPRAWGTGTGAGWAVDFDPSDGDVITGLGVLGPYVIVYKLKKTFIIYDLDTGANRALSTSTGCVSHHSIAETPIGSIFLTPNRGVYVCDGTKVQQISDVIRPTFDALDPTLLSSAAGVFYDNHYYLSASSGGVTNDVTFDFDMVLKSWWKHSNAANRFTVWRPGSSTLLYAANPAGRIDQCYAPNVLQDAGANYAAQWSSGWLTPGSAARIPYSRHRVRQVRINAFGKFDFAFARDFHDGFLPWGSFDFTTAATLFGGADTYGGGGTYGDASRIRQAIANSLGVGQVFSFRFSSDILSSSAWRIEDFTLFVTDRKD